MNYFTKLHFTFWSIFLLDIAGYSQCNNEQVIEICDMKSLDYDGINGPDGIINLYDQTGTTPADGTWSIAPTNGNALKSDGNLQVWEFFDSTTEENYGDYTLTLNNSSTCGDDPVLTVILVIEPFSGIALPINTTTNANIEICDSDVLDLFAALTTNATTPPPHLNGSWEFVSNSSGLAFQGSFNLTDGRFFQANLPYNPNNLFENEVFEYKYTVVGDNDSCALEDVTTVRVSVVRQVYSGEPMPQLICESDVLAGQYDNNIDLRDDDYLVGEDNEGIWLFDRDPTGQLENEQDSEINIKEIYDQLTNNGNNLRFGCQDYSFVYLVQTRFPNCDDDVTSIDFTIFEELRPFQQVGDVPELCANDENNPTFNLFDVLEFTTQNSQNFVYEDDRFVSWRLVSGPSDLGLLEQPASLSEFASGVNYSDGTVRILEALPGTYVFEYGATPDINCATPGIRDPYVTDPLDPTYSNHPCNVLTTLVTIEILPYDYAGENTNGLIFCKSETEINLIEQLTTTFDRTIVDTGVWTDENGDVVDNIFTFPDFEEVSMDFRLSYDTVNTQSGCTDSAILEFSVYNEAYAGENATIKICTDDLSITLFDHLGGEPDTNGIWTGPFGYESPDHLGIFEQGNDDLPILGPGDYQYTVPGNAGCPDEDRTILTIEFVRPEEIGTDRNGTFCKIDGRVNLYTLLDADTDRRGFFEDTDQTGALNPEDGIVEFANLTNGIYDFRYVIENNFPCTESSLIVSVQIVDLPLPNVPEQQFCILDAARLEDIEVVIDTPDDLEVDLLNFVWYETLESDIPIIDNPLLFDAQVYYVATSDVDGCESERVEVMVDILNIGEIFTNGEKCFLDFQDGVSPDGNNQNDTFDLSVEGDFNIPEAFPDFELTVFNRYGSIVYEGNKNIEEFNGTGNATASLGDDLPSGIYYYIFTPNFENNLPIQGSFYLSK